MTRKVEVYRDERWPDYGMSERDHLRSIEVSDEFWARYEAVCKAYDDLQQELAKLYE